jgi:hypothetical protein
MTHPLELVLIKMLAEGKIEDYDLSDIINPCPSKK